MSDSDDKEVTGVPPIDYAKAVGEALAEAQEEVLIVMLKTSGKEEKIEAVRRFFSFVRDQLAEENAAALRHAATPVELALIHDYVTHPGKVPYERVIAGSESLSAIMTGLFRQHSARFGL